MRQATYAMMNGCGWSCSASCGTDAAITAMPNIAASMVTRRVCVAATFAYRVKPVQTLHIA